MKNFKVIIFIIMFSGIMNAWAQNKLVLKDNTVLQIDSVFKINAYFVEYAASGSIHDMEIAKIKYIEDADEFIVFNEDNVPEYKHLNYKYKIDTKEKSQITTNNSERHKQAMAISFHFFPLALLEPDGGIRAGLEIPLKPTISFHQDINILFRTEGGFLEQDLGVPENFKGFAYRGEFKFYLDETNKKGQRLYVAPQLMFKQKKWDSHYFGTDLFNQQIQQRIYAGNLKVGITSKVSRKFVADIYTGLGIRYKETKNTIISTQNSIERSVTYTNMASPNVLLGISFGYRLGI